MRILHNGKQKREVCQKEIYFQQNSGRCEVEGSDLQRRGIGGGGRIRTCEARRATDLQSVGISHSPTPPCGSEGIVLGIVLVVQIMMAHVSVFAGAC